MDERERIRRKVAEATARLDAAQAAAEAATGRQAAYRSRFWWMYGGENANAGSRPADDAPVEEIIRWATTSTPDEEEFRRRREVWRDSPSGEEWRAAHAALYDVEFEGAVRELEAGKV